MSITDIRSALTTSIKSMTIEGGYKLDWNNCTVNPVDSDWNAVSAESFPIADCWFQDGERPDPKSSSLTVLNIETLIIDIVPKQEGITAEDVDKCILDIKRLSGNDYNLRGSCFYWYVLSYKRFNDQMHYPEYGARITCKVEYQEDRKNP